MMKFFVLSYSFQLDNFDDILLQSFLDSHDIVNIDLDFFKVNDIQKCALAIQYLSPDKKNLETDNNIKKTSSLKNNKEDEILKELSEIDKELYFYLKHWRNATAKQFKYNPYIVFTNLQISLIVKAKPNSIAKISEIEGIGKAKADKYGQSLLESMQKFNDSKGIKNE